MSRWRELVQFFRRTASRSPHARARLGFDVLEGRVTPAITFQYAPGGVYSFAENEEVDFQIHAVPEPGATVTVFHAYDPPNVPPGITVEQVDADTLRFHGTISYDAQNMAGTEGWETSLFAQLTPGNDYGYDAFNWQIENVNRAPEITSTGDPGDWLFVEGQEVYIMITAVDPDGDPLTFTANNLPPGLTIDYYDDTSAVISGTVQGHSETNPTKIYPVEIEVTDGEDDDVADPFCQATAFRVTTIGAITPPAGFTTLGIPPVEFTITISGVGAPPGGRDFLWSVIDSDGLSNDELQSERTRSTGAGAGTTGAWSVTLSFYLHKNTARHVAGADGASGEGTAQVFVRIESADFWDYGSNLGDSAVLNVTVTPP